MPRYVRSVRGDRLNPRPWNSRYYAIRQLADAMRAAAEHPDVTGDVIVDFGCGDAPYEPVFAQRFKRYVRADLPGNPHAQITIGSDGALPLDASSASAVLSSQVLEHVRDPKRYLTEAHRVLVPNGLLLVSTHGAWRYHPDPADYWRWTRDGLELELENAGFATEWVRGVLGPAATAMQLLQDAAASVLPRGINRVPGLVMQPVIGIVERLRREVAPADSAIYLMIARRVTR